MNSRKVALAFFAFVGVWSPICHRSPGSKPIGNSPARTALTEATGAIRPSLGRLTGGFLYSSFQVPRPRLKPTAQLIAARDWIYNEAEQRPNPQATADAGILAIIDHQIPKSVTLLEQATEADPRNALLQSDLAAVYIAKATTDRSPLYYVKALAAAEKACSLRRDLQEAVFNRALALELLGITWEAKRAWLGYLRLDYSSPWADEARQRLHTIEMPSEEELWSRQRPMLIQSAMKGGEASLRVLVTRFQFRMRQYGEEILIAQWADLQREGRFEAAGQALDDARKIGGVIAQVSGDWMLADAVAVVDRVQVLDRKELENIAKGHLNFRRGLILYELHDTDQAAIEFSMARDSLSNVGSPFGLWAEFYLAACLYQSNKYVEANKILISIEDRATGHRYPNLLGRTLWIKGLIEVVQSRYERAFAAYRESLLLFQKTGEWGHAAFVRLLIFEYFYFLGEEEEGWRNIHLALSMVDRDPDPRRQSTILWGGALAAIRANEPEIAVYFQDEAVRIARCTKKPANIASALRGYARVKQQAGLIDEALIAVSAAKEEIKKIPSEETRRIMKGDLLLIEGDLLRSRRPELSIQALDKSIETFRKTEYHAELVRALLARARTFIAASSPSRAAEDFAAAVDEIEQQRVAFSGITDRAKFWDGARMLFNEAAGFHANVLRRPDLAYGFVEQARGRALLDLILAKRLTKKKRELFAHPPYIEEICQRIPQKVILIQFGVLEDRVLVWAMWRTGSRFVERPMAARVLSQQVGNLRTAITRRQRQRAEHLGKEMYRALFGRLLDELPTQAVKVLIPDAGLHDLPFAALRNPKDGKFLIEEHLLEYAPSAEIYLSRSLPRSKKIVPKLLLVGNPDFDRSLLPHLYDLPGSKDEVMEVRQIFGGGQMLVGKYATKRAWLQLAPQYTILHLATHAVVHPSVPMNSYIVLARSSDPGILYAHEIYARDFDNVDLVFLSGCKTASGATSESEGVFSLARPFLAAGARTVIGSLWEIDDRTASQVSVEFYQHLQAGGSPAEALRSAQLKLLYSGQSRFEDPVVWAAFAAIGSGP